MNHRLPIAWMAEIQRERVRREMTRSRPMDSAAPGAPGFQERLALRLGGALITAGERLQAPYEPALGSEPEISRSGC
jgi:hypothetical protein